MKFTLKDNKPKETEPIIELELVENNEEIILKGNGKGIMIFRNGKFYRCGGEADGLDGLQTDSDDRILEE